MSCITATVRARISRLPANRRRGELHSASVLLTGLYLTAVLLELWVVLVPLAALKLLLYLERHCRYGKVRRRSVLTAARMLLGFIVPVLVVRASYPLALAFASVLAGEIIDRVEF